MPESTREPRGDAQLARRDHMLRCDASQTHRAFVDHVRTCDHCLHAYPWCADGSCLERLADEASERCLKALLRETVR